MFLCKDFADKYKKYRGFFFFFFYKKQFYGYIKKNINNKWSLFLKVILIWSHSLFGKERRVDLLFIKYKEQAGLLSLSFEISVLNLYTVGHSSIWSNLCSFAPSCWRVIIVWTVQSHRLWSGCLYKKRVGAESDSCLRQHFDILDHILSFLSSLQQSIA